MAIKFLLALLSLMLCIILVFNAFGVYYAPNDFMGTMLTVESGINKVSTFALSAFDKLKEFVFSGVDLLGSVYDATLGKFIKWIEDTFDLSIWDILKDLIQSILNFIRETSVYFEFFGKYGIGITQTYFEEISAFSRCVKDSAYWEDYSSRKGFNWSLCEDYIAYKVHGEDNAFSYLTLTYRTEAEKLWVSRLAKGEALKFGASRNWYSSTDRISTSVVDFYFTTIDISPPSFDGSLLTYQDMLEIYYQGEDLTFPVYDTNIYITNDNGVKFYLSTVRINYQIIKTVEYENKTFYSNGRVAHFFRPDVYMAFDFCFNIISDNGELVPVWFSPVDVFNSMYQEDMSVWSKMLDYFNTRSWIIYPIYGR